MIQGIPHRPGNGAEGDLSPEVGMDCLLIGAVEDTGAQSALR